MVKFGLHNAIFRERLPPCFYIINYNDLKEYILSDPPSEYAKRWQACNNAHNAWYRGEMTALYKRVLFIISEVYSLDVRGLKLSAALRIFVNQTHEAEPSECDAASDSPLLAIYNGSTLLRHLKNVDAVCRENMEALRKAVKKFDKNNKEANLSASLLCELYMSATMSGPEGLRSSIRLCERLIRKYHTSLDSLETDQTTKMHFEFVAEEKGDSTDDGSESGGGDSGGDSQTRDFKVERKKRGEVSNLPVFIRE